MAIWRFQVWNNSAQNVYRAVVITCAIYFDVRQRLIWTIAWFSGLFGDLGLKPRLPIPFTNHCRYIVLAFDGVVKWARAAQIFQNCRRQRNETSVAQAVWHPGFVHPCLNGIRNILKAVRTNSGFSRDGQFKVPWARLSWRLHTYLPGDGNGADLENAVFSSCILPLDGGWSTDTLSF
jgi:hypothetical protein